MSYSAATGRGQARHCPLARKESTFQQVGLAGRGLRNQRGGVALSQGCLAQGHQAQGHEGLSELGRQGKPNK